MPATHTYRDGQRISVEDARTLDEAKAERIALIKAEAAARIEEIAPLWRQLNWLREGKTAEFEAVDAIRQASDQAEARVAAARDNGEADRQTIGQGRG